ncbi:MAG TPA: 3D-(3,5/4)-trihydroxycyclohexane-1,2-dione acylhydrolase (decyclizing) [Vicinamibacteria bacterium]|nr:3D-(3,5/4)-trihydroxycyclohexane-1,2-dione acylhydrolase (decyclizing) [Vicinamibacteria bacterium]
MTTRRLTMAGALVEFLERQYVERDGREHRLINGVFGIFGHGNVAGVGQALEERAGAGLPYHQAKNEQAMVHTATAFAKARRGLGTFACTSSIGPGATNMVTGAATATVNRLPVLLLPGDVFANRLPNPVLQQLESPHSMDLSVNDCFRPVSRYWDRINRPEQLLAALPEAVRVLGNPATMGAVTIALPQDVQAEAYDYPAAFFEKRVQRIARARADGDALAAAADLVRRARRPFIVAGGGVYYSEAEAALRALAERTGIAVGVTQAGKSALAESHPLGLGAVGVTGTLAANRLAAEADLVLCLGTRLGDFTTASKTQFQDPGVRFVAVNVDAHDAQKHGALPLVGDARAVLEELAAALGGHRVAADYAGRVAALREEWEREYQAMVHPTRDGGRMHASEVIRVLHEELGPEATIVHAAGGLPGDLHKLWKSKAPGDYHSEYGYSCMGYEIAGALGVKMARPERDVYALLGDGSYLMLSQEIVTSVQEGRKLTLVLFDNHGYDCIHNLQRSCGSAGFGNEFRERDAGSRRLEGPVLAVDYVANAQSLGAATFCADSEDGLRRALAQARQESRTALVYVPVEPHTPLPGYSWWDVPVSQASSSEAVQAARARYDQAVTRRRFHH